MTHPQPPIAAPEPPAVKKSRVKGCLVPVGCLVLGLIIGTAAAGGGSKGSGTPGPTPTATVTVTATPRVTGTGAPAGGQGAVAAGGMTKAKFDQLANGMTEEQVFAIAGTCELTSNTEIAGTTADTYTCKAADGYSNAVLMFQGKRLNSKSQFGLK